MLEVEAKYRVNDWSNVVRQLVEWGAGGPDAREDIDQYFSAPDRDFGETNEAFRLRRIGEVNYFTYKGPRRDTTTKTRPEVEVRLADGTEVARLAETMVRHLGYAPFGTVRKHRQVYHLRRDGFDVEVCLDEVESLGRFVEIEILAEEADYERAKDVLLAIAGELDLKNQEQRSYVSMVWAQSRGSG